jgi:hypothetical protein
MKIYNSHYSSPISITIWLHFIIFLYFIGFVLRVSQKNHGRELFRIILQPKLQRGTYTILLIWIHILVCSLFFILTKFFIWKIYHNFKNSLVPWIDISGSYSWRVIHPTYMTFKLPSTRTQYMGKSSKVVVVFTLMKETFKQQQIDKYELMWFKVYPIVILCLEYLFFVVHFCFCDLKLLWIKLNFKFFQIFNSSTGLIVLLDVVSFLFHKLEVKDVRLQSSDFVAGIDNCEIDFDFLFEGWVLRLLPDSIFVC